MSINSINRRKPATHGRRITDDTINTDYQKAYLYLDGQTNIEQICYDGHIVVAAVKFGSDGDQNFMGALVVTHDNHVVAFDH